MPHDAGPRRRQYQLNSYMDSFDLLRLRPSMVHLDDRNKRLDGLFNFVSSSSHLIKCNNEMCRQKKKRFVFVFSRAPESPLQVSLPAAPLHTTVFP